MKLKTFLHLPLVLVLVLVFPFTSLRVYALSNPPFVLANASSPCFTPTFDGSGEVVHPDIIKFYTNKPQGYNYIMSITGFYHGRIEYELPHILFSNDGKTFTADGVKNPIEPQPPTGYYPDTEIIWFQNKFWVYFTGYFTPGYHPAPIYMKNSEDGVSWTTKVLIPNIFDSISMVVDGNTIKCWEEPLSFSAYGRYFESSDGYNFIQKGTYHLKLIGPNGYEWYATHRDFHKLSNGQYWVITIGFDPIKEPWSAPESRKHWPIFFGVSSDGLNYQMYSEPILRPSGYGWDKQFLYKSAFIVEQGKIKVWYGGVNPPSWFIGYTEADVNSLVETNVVSDNVIGSVTPATILHIKAKVDGVETSGIEVTLTTPTGRYSITTPHTLNPASMGTYSVQATYNGTQVTDSFYLANGEERTLWLVWGSSSEVSPIFAILVTSISGVLGLLAVMRPRLLKRRRLLKHIKHKRRRHQ